MKHDSLVHMLTERFADAVAAVADAAPGEIDPSVRPAGDPKFGDYQCNVAMSLAKRLKSKPRDIAERIKAAVEPGLADVVEPLEIAGPGFINIRLRSAYLAQYLGEVPAPPADEAEAAITEFEPDSGGFDRVGLSPVDNAERVVVEYSQPNIAKQMHVGHLRGTVIGDVFARVLALEGHEVIRQNHIGDWGTQFGTLIRWYREQPRPTPETHGDVLAAISADYQAAQKRFKEDADFAREARAAVAELQSGDPQARELWEWMCAESWRAFTETYERLGVLLKPADVRGESFYNDRLGGLVEELRKDLPPRAEGLLAEGQRPERPWVEVRDDQGAVCVFLWDEQGEPQFKTPTGDPLPMIIRKSDGAYLYATTDLAAIRFRLHELHAMRVIYVTDARQKLHFQMWMATARAAGWIDQGQRVEHVTFGSVLGEDRRPLKTRAGGAVKLHELLDEAEKRAYELLRERNAGGGAAGAGGADADAMNDDEMRQIARRVGVAAVKYADLRNDRNADYVFAWDKMITFQGNTAPYMMYAYARIRSIYRKAAERRGATDVYDAGVSLRLDEPAERALALRLAQFRETVDTVAADLCPHVLCAYLYDVATEFMRFYESCPVLGAVDEATQLSRLRLCDLTARTLKLGLGLLGIGVLERM